MTLTLSQAIEIKPEDFEPPLKRKEALVPYYWTVEELAEELGISAGFKNGAFWVTKAGQI